MTAGGLSREASLTGSVTRGGMLLAMGARGETWRLPSAGKNEDVRVWRPCCKWTTNGRVCCVSKALEGRVSVLYHLESPAELSSEPAFEAHTHQQGHGAGGSR